MYDYATYSKQVDILNAINSFNTNFLTYTQYLYNLLYVIAILVTCIFLYSLIITCLGGKK